MIEKNVYDMKYDKIVYKESVEQQFTIFILSRIGFREV